MLTKKKWKFFIILPILILTLLIIACDEEKNNPVPVLSTISPDTAEFNYGDLTITVSGSDFVPNSVVKLNGTDLMTEYISTSELRATVPSSIFIPSSSNTGEDEDFAINVENPTPGGGSSANLNLTGTFPLEFTSPLQITKNTDASMRPAIAVDGNENIYITYQLETTGKYRIRFLRSTNGGQSFSEPVLISSTNGHSQNPSIAAYTAGDINYVFVTYSVNRSGKYQIYLTRSTDGGATFEEPINISNSTGGASRSHIQVNSSGDVYVVWYDERYGPSEIMVCKSTDYGVNFQTPMPVTSNGVVSIFPYVTFDQSDNLLISWYQLTTGKYDVFFAKSIDGGKNYNIRHYLSKNHYNSRFPKVVADQNNVYHYFWHDDSPHMDKINRLYYRKSTNAGASFHEAEILTEDDVKSERPIPMIDLFNNLNLIYTSDRRNKVLEVYYTRSIDSGVSFPVTQRLSALDGAQFARAVTAPDGTVYVAWNSRIVGSREIFFCKSTN
ncbi:MAG: exo-alpha-sialidase [Acidobacteria bacterium]|nr:exo-alpha-sialidase [Acidobacteriota bacterium]